MMPQTPFHRLTASAPSVTQRNEARWAGRRGSDRFPARREWDWDGSWSGRIFQPASCGRRQHLNAWAGTVDLKNAAERYFELTVNGYRGQALAGLGGGGYVNYYDLYEGSEEYRTRTRRRGGLGPIEGSTRDAFGDQRGVRR